MSDIIIETRVKIEDIYKAVMYMESIDVHPHTRSSVASSAIRLVSSLYEGELPPVEEMIEYINRKFNIQVGFSKSGRSAISSALLRKMQTSQKEDTSDGSIEDMMKKFMKGE